MKFLIIAILSLTSTLAFSNEYRVATSYDKLKLCMAVEEVLIEENADMAVNLDYCPKAFIRVKGNVIEGNVPFLSPGRSFDMKCRAKVVAGKVSLKTVSCK